MTKGDIAKKLFEEGYNCSQAVFGAFAEDLGIDFNFAVKLASGFGGGMGRLREVCGTVTGMFMVLSMKYGYDDPKANAEKKQIYKDIQSITEKFKEENGSIICRDLLGLTINGADSPIPEKRTEKYYKKRPCSELCKYAGDLVEEFIKNHN
jgi:C_GCAxxG_C_C family probable redox protein